ncbi:LOB domain-containing protein [Heracleum sosnowskyi]|uniref:LOB domain-containing protein n=1 Tax=Heracleum sosnowskyi TaxID=360622 RepID=A0AAD8GTC6_9APIA|nr:LOB domain-containing protein [Heracleum sosnowskyi]
MNGPGANTASTPCAACKYLRRRCNQSCFLADYFPATKSQEYLICHRVYGTYNLVKIIKSVQEQQRHETVATLIMEAQMRVSNPVHGCFVMHKLLQAQIDENLKELDAVKKQLFVFESLHSQIELLDNQLMNTSLAVVPQSDSEAVGNRRFFGGGLQASLRD